MLFESNMTAMHEVETHLECDQKPVTRVLSWSVSVMMSVYLAACVVA